MRWMLVFAVFVGLLGCSKESTVTDTRKESTIIDPSSNKPDNPVQQETPEAVSMRLLNKYMKEGYNLNRAQLIYSKIVYAKLVKTDLDVKSCRSIGLIKLVAERGAVENHYVYFEYRQASTGTIQIDMTKRCITDRDFNIGEDLRRFAHNQFYIDINE